MSAGQLVITKHRKSHGEWGFVFLKSVDELLALRLPKLRLPTMNEEARAAFRALLAYEVPVANGSVRDTLHFIEARGNSVHPCDWIPDYDWLSCGFHPELYQPWVDWLSENGFTKFHGGNTITSDNCRRFSPPQRRGPIFDLILKGRHDNFAGIKEIAKTQPASMRSVLCGEIDAGGLFYGYYPWQTPLLEYFLKDKSDKVSKIAREKLDRMGELTTEAAYAHKIADEIMAPETFKDREFDRDYSSIRFRVDRCLSFEVLAEVLGLTPIELANRPGHEDLGILFGIAAQSGSVEVRSIFAKRFLENGIGAEYLPKNLFKGLPTDLRQQGLQVVLKATHSWNSVQDYLDLKTGTLDPTTMRGCRAHEFMASSVKDELQSGKLPVNKMWDPLRVLGKIVNKEAAQQVIDEVLTLGMSLENPRLTMLKLNIAL